MTSGTRFVVFALVGAALLAGGLALWIGVANGFSARMPVLPMLCSR